MQKTFNYCATSHQTKGIADLTDWKFVRDKIACCQFSFFNPLCKCPLGCLLAPACRPLVNKQVKIIRSCSFFNPYFLIG